MNKTFMVIMLGLGIVLSAGVAGAEDAVIAIGKKVKFDYTLTVDGQAVETTQGKQPLLYVHGKGQLIQGLERQMEGLKVGEAKTILVTPEEGYGPLREDAYQEFPKDRFPKGMYLEPGTVLNMEDEDGNTYRGVILEVKEYSAVVNFNHRFAGKILKFDVKVISVE
ncbi:MAG: peptidylprolyl isomerase [Candidatus Omnitrophica bacterium]|nr:peptidylprolyl isomerase [Candidatus Omnitrophota bacterium]